MLIQLAQEWDHRERERERDGTALILIRYPRTPEKLFN